MKNVQIITKRINVLSADNDIETVRQRIENHINNGWKIQSSNMFDSKDYIYLYALLIKE